MLDPSRSHQDHMDGSHRKTSRAMPDKGRSIASRSRGVISHQYRMNF